MDSSGQGQPTNTAQLSPVSSTTSSYFLQLDPASGRIEIMDSSMVSTTATTRPNDLGPGDETVYEIRDDDYFLSGQFMEHGLQEIDSVDINDLLSEKPMQMQGYTPDDSLQSNNTFTNLSSTNTASALVGYEGIESETGVQNQQRETYEAPVTIHSSMIGNNFLRGDQNNLILCGNSYPLTSVQLLNQNGPLNMNCDIIDSNSVNRLVMTNHEPKMYPGVDSETLQFLQEMQSDRQQPVTLIQVTDPAEQARILNIERKKQEQVQQKQEQLIILQQHHQNQLLQQQQQQILQQQHQEIKQNEFLLEQQQFEQPIGIDLNTFESIVDDSQNNQISSISASQPSQSFSQEEYNSTECEPSIELLEPTTVLEEDSKEEEEDDESLSYRSEISYDLDLSDEFDEEPEMDIQIVSCFSQQETVQFQEPIESNIPQESSSTKSSKDTEANVEKDSIETETEIMAKTEIMETDTENIAKSSEMDSVEKDVESQKESKSDIIEVKKPLIPEWLSSCVDKDDELLIAFKNRPDEDSSKPIICCLCYSWHSTHNDLMDHLRNQHMNGNSKIYECQKCNSKFIARVLLKRHEKLHKYDMKLPWYKYQVENLNPFDLKITRHFTQRFRPAPFSKSYRSHLKKVFNLIKNLAYDCFDCGLTFPEEEIARAHYEKYHAIQECNHCQKILENLKDLRQHSQDFHGDYSIDENYIGGAWFLWEHWLCEESVRKEEIISNIAYFHNYSKNDKENVIYVEDFIDASELHDTACLSNATIKTELNTGEMSTVSDSAAIKSEDKLENIDADFNESFEYQSDEEEEITFVNDPVRRARIKEEEELSKLFPSSSLPFKCDQCSKSYDNEHDLRRHVRCHDKDRQPLVCQFCGKSFKTHSHKKEHERTHTGEKPYSCPICNRSFIQSSNLKKHIQTHKSENTLQCQTCGKQFIKESSLVLHQRAHASDRKFRCEVCDRAYNYASLLKRHMRIHTGELPYSCDICGMLFHELVSLHYHRKKIHTGERPHKCETCGRAFILSSDLKKHLQIHVNKNPSERVLPKISRRRSQIKSTESDGSYHEAEKVDGSVENSLQIEVSARKTLSPIKENNEPQKMNLDADAETLRIQNEKDNLANLTLLESLETQDIQTQEVKPEEIDSLRKDTDEAPIVAIVTKANVTKKSANVVTSKKSKPPILRVYKKSATKPKLLLPAVKRSTVPSSSESSRSSISVSTFEDLPQMSNINQQSYTIVESENPATSQQYMTALNEGTYLKGNENIRQTVQQTSYVLVSIGDTVQLMSVPQVAPGTIPMMTLQESPVEQEIQSDTIVQVQHSFQNKLSQDQNEMYGSNLQTVNYNTIDNNSAVASQMLSSQEQVNNEELLNEFNMIVEAPDISEEVTVNDTIMNWE